MDEIIDDLPSVPGNDSPSSRTAGEVTDFLEVEVKFLVDDLAMVRGRLTSMGAEAGSPRVYERNVRFDTAEEALLRRQELLRLRRDTRARLTFKGPSAAGLASEAKVREEIELEIEDFDRMAAILQRLGLNPIQKYEKYRETFHWNDVEIALDEMPFGNFVELEGQEAEIKAAAAALGLEWSRRVLINYLALMGMAKRAFDLPFSDLTFADFQRRPVDMSELLPICALSDAGMP
jgi:adenylate cyclase class 2